MEVAPVFWIALTWPTGVELVVTVAAAAAVAETVGEAVSVGLA